MGRGDEAQLIVREKVFAKSWSDLTISKENSQKRKKRTRSAAQGPKYPVSTFQGPEDPSSRQGCRAVDRSAKNHRDLHTFR